jgi:predicted flap endonuclease-1-like 5' DNA nuclease
MNSAAKVAPPAVNLNVDEDDGFAPLSTSVRSLLEASRDVGESSLALVEEQVDTAIRLSEEFRDRVVTAEVKAKAPQDGLRGRFRSHTHRLVDIVFDISSQVRTIESVLDFSSELVVSTAGVLQNLVTGKAEGEDESLLRGDLISVEGIGPVYARRLREAGIRKVEELLAAGATPAGRQQLAQTTGLSPKRILTWINHADLFRVAGVAEEYADLLEAAGVDSVPELAQRTPEQLHQRLAEANAAIGRVRRLPSQAQVAGWIEEAKTLPRIVTY